jgi:hypothetical protein
MPGLVQHMVIEADTTDQLVSAIEILLQWDKKVTHFVTGLDAATSAPYLALLWSMSPSPVIIGEDEVPQRLLAPATNAARLGQQVAEWLSMATYPKRPGGDGDHVKGWRVAAGHGFQFDRHPPWKPYVTAVIQPAWIYYSK